MDNILHVFSLQVIYEIYLPKNKQLICFTNQKTKSTSKNQT